MAKAERYVRMKRMEMASAGGVGLLTTVDELPYNYKIQYVRPESPLDLSKKSGSVDGDASPIHRSLSPQSSISSHSPVHLHPKKRHRFDSSNDENETQLPIANPAKIRRETTPKKPVNVISLPKAAAKASPVATTKEPKKQHKAVRKLKFDEKKSSPVSGTIIRALDEIDENVVHESGDIDPEYNIVEVTEEIKAEIAAIPNVIGAYICKLCEIEFEDVFGLARHRCSCIVLLEYRCPECGKRFNCPANLASHRRWHKPKEEIFKKSTANTASESDGDTTLPFPCEICGKHFKRQAYLRKHLATHNKTTNGVGAVTTLPTAKRVAREGSITDGAASSTAGNSVRHSVCSDDSVSSSASQDGSQSTHSHTSRVKFTIADLSVLKEAAEEHSVYMPAHHRPPSGPAFRSSPFFFKREIFTEEENIAAAALAHLRHSQDSVIRHTTALSI